jgi:predicted CopG family antitoxin
MNKDLLSIEHDDDNEDYEAFNEFLTKHTERNKKKAYSEIEMFGDSYLKEIEWKKKKETNKKNKLIPYIIKHSEGKYDSKTLAEYSYEDVLDIYNEYRNKNRSFLSKIFHFIFNLS